jgi:hypothetical protein
MCADDLETKESWMESIKAAKGTGAVVPNAAKLEGTVTLTD